MKAAGVAAANASVVKLRPSHPVGGAWRLASLVPVLWALAGFAAAPVESRIQFPGNSTVPRAVQEFAWRVIETRCNYQAYEY